MITKEEIREALVQNLTKSGKKLTASTETLDSLIEALYESKVKEDTTVDVFVKDNLALFEKIEGNVRKDVSIELKKAELITGKNKAKLNSQPIDVNQSKADDPNNAVLEMIKSLQETVNTMKLDKTVAEKKAQLKVMLDSKGIKNKSFIDTFIKNVSINEDSDLDDVTGQGLNLYNSVIASGVSPNATPSQSSKANGKVDFSDVEKEFKKE